MNKNMLFTYEKNTIKTDLGLLILRLFLGGVMLYSHGWGKMMKLFGDDPIKFADPIGIGMEASLWLTVFAEVVCAFLIAIGLTTRWATIPLIITMLVAVFVIHADDPFGKKEFALLYMVPLITLLLSGAGRFSLDSLFNKKNSSEIL